MFYGRHINRKGRYAFSFFVRYSLLVDRKKKKAYHKKAKIKTRFGW